MFPSISLPLRGGLVVASSLAIALTAACGSSSTTPTKAIPDSGSTQGIPDSGLTSGLSPASCPDWSAMTLSELLTSGGGFLDTTGGSYPVDFIGLEQIDSEIGLAVLAGQEQHLLFLPFDENEEPTGAIRYIKLATNTSYSGTVTLPDQPQESETIQLPVFELNQENGDETIEISLCAILGAGTSQITIDGTTATLTGTLGSLTFAQFEKLQTQRPDIQRLVLQDVPGSVNDEINVETGRLVRTANWQTVLGQNSDVASGGVDLFIAGATRTIEKGGRLGVHSWSDGLRDGADFPKGSPVHDSLLAYSNEMLGEKYGSDFYWFTLAAAPAASVHWMTAEEIQRFRIVTETD